jgi:hypothetical protein
MNFRNLITGFSEPSLAVLVIADCLIKVFFSEIRPVFLAKKQFSIGNLPK